MWLSLYLAAFSPLSIYADASIRGSFQHSPAQSLEVTHGRTVKGLPALLLFQKQNSLLSCTDCQMDLLPVPVRREGRCKEEEEALLLHTQLLLCLHAETREKPPDWCLLPWTSLSVWVCTSVKDGEWQGQGLPLTITQSIGGMSFYEYHPETPITLTPRRSQKWT